MILYFPHMHPELLSEEARAALPAEVRFLDPGLAPADSAAHALPESAPFDRRTAKAILADTLRFGESVAAPRDIAVHGLLQQAETLAPEGARQVAAEVERSIAGVAQAESRADPLDEARRQAQTLLLLAWNLEERLVELRGIDQRLRESWQRLGESVAPAEAAETDVAEEGDLDEDSRQLGQVLAHMTPPDAEPDAEKAGLPWRRMLQAFAVLAPGARLATTDPSVGSALREAGLVSSGTAAAPAWRLAGLDRCPEDRPWLDAELTLVLAGAAAKEGA